MKHRLLQACSVILILGCVLVALGYFVVDSKLSEDRYFAYCELLQPGISLAESEEKLLEIGQFDTFVGDPINSLQLVEIHFKNTITRLSIGKMILVFENDELTAVTRQVGVSDRAPGADCDEIP